MQLKPEIKYILVSYLEDFLQRFVIPEYEADARFYLNRILLELGVEDVKL